MAWLKSDEDALQTMMSRIYDTLRSRGVPEVRLPEPKHLISHIMLWVDEDKMNKWIDGFSSLETIHKLSDGQIEKVVGTGPSPASEAFTQAGNTVLMVRDKAREVAGNILSAVKQNIIEQKTS